MKRCPRCNKIYSDNDLNFCLDDGELLQPYNDEQPTRPLRGTDPPTIVMDSPRVTDPIGWQAGQPIGQSHRRRHVESTVGVDEDLDP